MKGVANFAGCAINTAGTGYKINATSAPAITPAPSAAFNVAVAGAPTKLAFVTQPPAAVVAGVPFSAVQVAIENASNTVITSGITASIRLSIGNGPNGATLTCAGGNTATTVNGVATFTGCSVSKAGNGYALVARAVSTNPTTTLAQATSRTFNAAASSAVITLLPSQTVILWGGTVFLNVHIGTNGAGKSIQLQVSRDQVAWSTLANLVTNGNGDAAFPYRPSDNRYYRVTFAGTPDLAPAIGLIARVVVRQLNLLRPTNLGRIVRLRAGTGITFTSTVRPARPELPQAHVNFVVYRLIGSQWTLALNQTIGVNAAGQASLRVTFSNRASFYVRSQAVPTTANANSVWSPVERYDVT